MINVPPMEKTEQNKQIKNRIHAHAGVRLVGLRHRLPHIVQINLCFFMTFSISAPGGGHIAYIVAHIRYINPMWDTCRPRQGTLFAPFPQVSYLRLTRMPPDRSERLGTSGLPGAQKFVRMAHRASPFRTDERHGRTIQPRGHGLHSRLD